MKVELLHNTPLWVCAKAIRKCWASEDKSDTLFDVNEYQCQVCGEDHYSVCPNFHIREQQQVMDYHEVLTGQKDKELIYRIGNKNKHKSTLEHLVYTFDIDGISRACLQELARHRIASYSVKSTRYTLKELKNYEPITSFNFEKFAVSTGKSDIDIAVVSALEWLQKGLQSNVTNDVAKYCLPEAYKTSLVTTVNARALQNFLELRTSKSALWEIRELAREMFEQLPDDHKYLFEEFVSET